MSELHRKLLILAGTLSAGLGILGIFLPVLPTTPFLLLSAACYARSSQRFYNWLMNSRYLGEYIRNYREGRGLPLVTKVVTLVLLWAFISYSAFVAVNVLSVRVILYLIAIAVTAHILTTPTFRR